MTIKNALLVQRASVSKKVYKSFDALPDTLRDCQKDELDCAFCEVVLFV